MDERWWADIEHDLLECLSRDESVRVRDIAGRVGLSEAAVNSLLGLLAQEGKIRISSVERAA